MEDEAVAGAGGAVAAVRAAGLAVAFLTNASGRTCAEVAERLNRCGIRAGVSEVLTSAAATARWLRAHDVPAVWVTGAAGLRAELRSAGVQISNRSDVAAVVVGLGSGADQLQAERLLPAALETRVRAGECMVVACNRDETYPGRDGALHPGCGAVVRRIEEQCGRPVDVVVGKPQPYMLECIGRDHGLTSGEIVVVGDSWASDVEMARRCGSPWAWVPAPGHRATAVPAGLARDQAGVVLSDIGEVVEWVMRGMTA